MTAFSINEPFGSTSNPLPFKITSLVPSEALMSGPDLTLRVLGSGFVMGMQIIVGGIKRTTSFVSRNELTTAIKPSAPLLPAGTHLVSVGVYQFVSNALPFTYIRAKETDAARKSA